MPMILTVKEARKYVQEHRHEGLECMVCDQHVEEYRWPLYSTAVTALILLDRLGASQDFVHSRNLKQFRRYKGQGDCSRLAKWGLVEEERTRRPDGGRSGYWKLTELGRRFLAGTTSVPKYIWVYNNKVEGRSDEQVWIEEALGKKFSLREIRMW